MSAIPPPPDPRTIVLFGLPFHDVTMEETLGWINFLVARRKPAYLATANLDFARQASEDVELQRILLEAELVLCDGTPLVWASRLTGQPLRERVAGSDLAPRLLANAEKHGQRIFLLGGDPSSLERAAANIQKNHPLLPKVQFYSPPFAPLHEFDNAEILGRIAAARPDILLVAFGCPKQEKWIYMNYRQAGVPVSIGVGATIDFLAGRVSRAPEWIARFGLEWVYRMVQEPRRLAGRYYADLLFLFRQTLRERRAISAPATPHRESPQVVEDSGEIELLRWSGALTAPRVSVFPVPSFKKPFCIDMSEITLVDSGGLGAMLRVMRRSWNEGVGGCFLSPSQPVRTVVQVTRLERILAFADTMEEAVEKVKRDAAAARLRPTVSDARGVLLFKVPQTVFSGNARECGEGFHREWDSRPEVREAVFDFSGTEFIDSSGLGFLIRSHRLVGQRPGAKLTLANLADNVLNVIRVSRLDGLLLAGQDGGEERKGDGR